MAYEVTATRRRPQRFEDLAGQEFVAETLRNAMQSEKIAHAYLFSGPRGCGKTSTARILAKALNCAKGPTATPCGICQQCQEITKGVCTDVIEIDGASNTSVNDVRQIKDEVLFPPQSCRYKIYIIDEVHMLSTSAFNALLKTIEEPPAYAIFMFATTELQKVPATIKSRCQQFNFRLVPAEKVKSLLAAAAEEIGIRAEEEALYWIARESTGSVRDAYTLFDQVAAFSGDEITYEKIRDKLGLVGVDRLNALFETCAANKPSDALAQIDDFLQGGISIEQLIANSTDYLRSLLLIKNGITKASLLGQSPDRFSRAVLDAWNATQLERGISLFLQLYRDIRYSLSPRYELELAFSRLSWLHQYVSPAEVKAAIDQAQHLLAASPQTAVRQGAEQTAHVTSQPQATADQSAPPKKNDRIPLFSALAGAAQHDGGEYGYAPDTAGQSVPPGAQNPFEAGGAVPPEQTAMRTATAATADELRDRLISEYKVTDALLASSLMHTAHWARAGNTVTATTDSEFLQKKIEAQRGKIAARLTEWCGEPMQFSVTVQARQQAAAQEIPPSVKIVCNAFRGNVISVASKAPEAAQERPATPAADDGAENTGAEPFGAYPTEEQ
ncbi:MAG: DNA polymerase III subunit gamma/tau, partial [Treponemataceae bacterium]|nr:DNA polymerase III subunit gamma/tau [Treponemataceae bacterium]